MRQVIRNKILRHITWHLICPAPSPVGFLNFHIDTMMNTGHKPHISDCEGFATKHSSLNVETPSTNFAFVTVSMYKLKNACRCSMKMSRHTRQCAAHRGFSPQSRANRGTQCPLSRHTPHLSVSQKVYSNSRESHSGWLPRSPE